MIAKLSFLIAATMIVIGAVFAQEQRRISDVEIAIAARACLDKGMDLYVVKENGKPVATTCIRWATDAK